jgi:predicted RNA binding protein YcfA (HicA-like mRNA interferase family)
MSKLPMISGRTCVKALQKVGFNFVRHKASHIYVVRADPPTQISVPDHKELRKGMLRAIIRQAGLTVDEFIELL